MDERAPYSPDQLFGLIANARRRHALRLLASERTMTLPDLADEVAVRERDARIDDIDPDDVAEIYFSLYHTHVPKLRDAGLLAYEQETDVVRATEAGVEVAAWTADVVDRLEG